MSQGPKIIRYGKSSGELIAIKRDFFEKNDELLAYQRRLAKLYVEQPKRTQCMCCAGPIEGRSFAKQGVDYVLCARCGHLNGCHQDTPGYGAAVYTADGGSEYAKFYSESDRAAYHRRMEAIYLPKVDFLTSSLKELGETPEQLSYDDYGSGSGYFVASLVERGLSRVTGHEVSEAQVNFGNKMIGRDVLSLQALDETAQLVGRSQADVISMISVLEHLPNPRQFLAALAANPKARYFYITVPLFSPTIFFEMTFPDVMQRLLSGGHTHLFTSSSLAWMSKEFSLQSAAEWWFGTDLVDLYRAITVMLGKSEETAGMVKTWSDWWAPMIDELQLVLDHKHYSSSVHVLYRIAR